MSDETKSEGAEIIELPVRLKDGGVESKLRTKRRAPTCLSHYFEVDSKERVVECSRCGAKLDGFQTVEYLARHWDNFEINRRATKSEIEQLRKERDDLDRQVKNLKAQKRRVDPVDGLLAALRKRRSLPKSLVAADSNRHFDRGFEAGVRASERCVEEWRRSLV